MCIYAGILGPLYAFSLFLPSVRLFRSLCLDISLISRSFTDRFAIRIQRHRLEPPHRPRLRLRLHLDRRCRLLRRQVRKAYVLCSRLARLGLTLVAGLVFNFGCLAMAMVGYIILIVSRNAQLSYFAIYLAASGYVQTPRLLSHATDDHLQCLPRRPECNLARRQQRRGIHEAICRDWDGSRLRQYERSSQLERLQGCSKGESQRKKTRFPLWLTLVSL